MRRLSYKSLELKAEEITKKQKLPSFWNQNRCKTGSFIKIPCGFRDHPCENVTTKLVYPFMGNQGGVLTIFISTPCKAAFFVNGPKSVNQAIPTI